MKTPVAALFLTAALFISGCATIFKGYYDTVEIINSPADLKIFTEDEIEMPLRIFQVEGDPILTNDGFYSGKYKQVTKTEFKIRPNKDRIIILHYADKKTKVELTQKLGIGWFLLDCITIVGLPIDYVTGNWFYYDPIVFEKK